MNWNNSEKIWNWQGFPITYQHYGNSGPAVILIHGFGASWRHWRKNIEVLGETCRCYALDLIGFGNSIKPIPHVEIEYTFETWGRQVGDFCREVVGTPAFFVGNSIGAIVAMQGAITYPELALGVASLNCSLRLLHERKRGEIPWYRSQGAAFVQKLLTNAWIGNLFFRQIARPKTVRNVLLQAYKRQEAVTEELIEIILNPARDPAASAVFRAFTCYSQGPLPEDLLPQLPCEALLLWGNQDPWEPVELGRELARFPTVSQFIELEGLGHCPQDEAPEVVNPLLQNWIAKKMATQDLCP